MNSLEHSSEEQLLAAAVQHVTKPAPPSNGTQRPVGYIRAKVYGRCVLVKSLVDSGNLFADLISEKLAKLLKLQVTGTERKVGTASANGSVTVIGKAKPFMLYL